MHHCVTDVAELTKTHVAQSHLLCYRLYLLPSMLHLEIAYKFTQGTKSKATHMAIW